MNKTYCSESLGLCINKDCRYYLDKKVFENQTLTELSNLKTDTCEYKTKEKK